MRVAPTVARKEPMSNKFWRGISENLLWWRTAEDQQEKSQYMAIYKRLLGYARPYIFPDLALAVLAMLVLSAANGAIPYLIKETINLLSKLKASDPMTVQRLHMLSLGILAVFIVRALTDFLASFLTDYIGMKTAMDLRGEFNDRLQRLPLSFFNWTPTGNLLTRSLNDVQLASSIITNSLISLIGDSLTLIALIGGLFWMDFKFALLAFVVFPVAILPIIGAARRVRKMSKSAQRKLSDLSVMMQEAVQGCRVVKAFGMEDYESERFRAMLNKQLRIMRRVLRAGAFSSPFIEVLGACAVVMVLWYGTSAVLAGSPFARNVCGVYRRDADHLQAVQKDRGHQQLDPAGTGLGRAGVRDNRPSTRNLRRARSDRAQARPAQHRVPQCQLPLRSQGRVGAARHQYEDRSGRDRGAGGDERGGQIDAVRPDPALL